MTREGATGAQVLTRMLSDAGVEIVFSLSGNQIMPIYDACIDTGIRIVHVRHEGAAVAMADAYAQVTGKVGVALVTAAPGFANALSPLFSARAAESPVLLLSGDSPLSLDEMGAFQELRQTEVSAPLVKAAFRPDSVDRLRTHIAEAFEIAACGRPGPVHLALPFDVLTAFDIRGRDRVSGVEPSRTPLTRDKARAVMERLKAAERPLILTGPQLARGRAGSTARALEDASGIPVVSMESPRGLRDPSLGAFAEMIVRSDCVLLLGKKADFTLGFLKPGALAPDASFICIDAEREVIDHARRLVGDRLVEMAVADAPLAADELARAACRHGNVEWRRAVADAIAWRGESTRGAVGLHPMALCTEVQALIETAEDPVLVCDGGEFGQWAQAACHAPTRIVNGISGAIGFGLCHAIAAKLARPHATVVVLMGDGTAGFHLAEFETAARVGANIVAVIGNDSRWNAEYQIQLRDYGPDRTIGCELSPTARYDQAAAAFGCHGDYVEDAAGLREALRRAAGSGKPACVNVMIDGAPAPIFSRGKAVAGGTH